MSGSQAPRPLMTLALSTWNHERYVGEAVAAALAQDYSPLEIIVSDDASTDGTWDIVQRLVAGYRGPHMVRLNRNARNLGVGAHCDRLMEMARGEMVVLSAGDDIDEPDRVSRIAAAYLESGGRIAAVSAPLPAIDDAGAVTGEVIAIGAASPITAESLAGSGAAIAGGAFARRLFGIFGPMGADVVAAEDVVLGLRAALAGDVAILAAPLMRYRRHGESLLGSSGPMAATMESHRHGFARMLRGIRGAREVQLRDLECARGVGLIDVARHELLHGLLARHAEAESLYLGVIDRRPGCLPRLAQQVLLRRIGMSEALKMVLGGFVPGLWFRYLRWRAPRSASSRGTP